MEKELTFTVTESEANQLVKALAAKPYEEVVLLIRKMMDQAQTQYPKTTKEMNVEV